MNTMSGTKGFVSIPLTDRFEEKVSPEPNTGCWLWTGACSPRGYGEIWVNGRSTRATHVALEFDGRPLRDGQMACHRCDNPSCVNPEHLFPGTMADNIGDCVEKRRHGSVTKPTPRGPRSPARQLLCKCCTYACWTWRGMLAHVKRAHGGARKEPKR